MNNFRPHLLFRLLASALLCFGAISGNAEVKLAGIFGDHMVLQEGASVPVWGWAEPGEEVVVKIQGQVRRAKADSNGKWMVKLRKLKRGEPTTLVVEGKNRIELQDVLIGEVWLCSGQSNMGMLVDQSKDFEAEKSAANLPSIRMFTVGRSSRAEVQTNCTGSWIVCSPETVGKFSATAYFFGREIHQRRHVPVGLINSSWGGTAVEAWTSMEAQSRLPEYPTIFEKWKAVEATPAQGQKGKLSRLDPNYPANLFNGMIAPLIPFTFRGVVWYQGENNAIANFPQIYGLQLRTMIKDWRTRWGSDFPFAWVQLPEWHEAQKQPVESTGWTTVREQMLKTLDVPHTGMAVTLGLGDAKDIHPKNKQDVGRRLASWALADVYRDKTVVGSGPLPAGFKIKGDKVVISFKHADGGLTTRGAAVEGFAIAGQDHRWMWAEAKIDGNKVVVSNSEIAHPVAVRYAWADNPKFSLYNGDGLPATPFRTDDWKE